MNNQDLHTHCSECWTVEDSIEVVVSIGGGSKGIRMDTLRDGVTGDRCITAQIEKRVAVQPTCPQAGGKFAKPPGTIAVWAACDLPWINEGSATTALARALGSLKEGCDQGARILEQRTLWLAVESIATSVLSVSSKRNFTLACAKRADWIKPA